MVNLFTDEAVDEILAQILVKAERDGVELSDDETISKFKDVVVSMIQDPKSKKFAIDDTGIAIDKILDTLDEGDAIIGEIIKEVAKITEINKSKKSGKSSKIVLAPHSEWYNLLNDSCDKKKPKKSKSKVTGVDELNLPKEVIDWLKLDQNSDMAELLSKSSDKIGKKCKIALDDFKIIEGKYYDCISWAEIERVLGIDKYMEFCDFMVGQTSCKEGVYVCDVENFLRSSNNRFFD